MTAQSPRKTTESDSQLERSTTVRNAMLAVLREEELSARELSTRLSIREREVSDHLEHLARSLRHGNERLAVTPPRCVRCGFVFTTRERLSKPSRCPQCRSERLKPARFSVISA